MRAYSSIEQAWDVLRDYLGNEFDPSLTAFERCCEVSEAEADRHQQGFYRNSSVYLYELTHFHFSGFKDEFFAMLLSYARAHGLSHFADIGCGIGLDAQALIASGRHVRCFDIESPCRAYLIWRFERDLGIRAAVRDPMLANWGSVELAYLVDVVEHLSDPLPLIRHACANVDHLCLNLFPHSDRRMQGFDLHYPLDHESIYATLDATHRLMRTAVSGDTVAQIWSRRS